MYLPAAKRRLYHPEHPCNPITLRHLLSHSASIGVDAAIGLSILRMGDAAFTDGTTLVDRSIDYLTRNSSRWLPHPPGTVSLYSNVGTALAAAVVEEVARMPYIEYIRERILIPLGIDPRRAAFRLSDIEHREDLVKQYVFNSSNLLLWQQELPQINVSQVMQKRPWSFSESRCVIHSRRARRTGSPSHSSVWIFIQRVS